MNELILSWQDVLDAQKTKSQKWSKNFQDFVSVAIKLGYKYIAWNDCVYVIYDDGKVAVVGLIKGTILGE